MNGRASSLILVPLTIQIAVSLIMGHFNAGTISGGIPLMYPPPTNIVAILADGYSYFATAMTFGLNMPIVSVFFWILTICEGLGIFLAIAHGN